MFLVAITGSPLPERLLALGGDRLDVDGRLATIVTDGLLSRRLIEPAGFAVVESVGGLPVAEVRYRRPDDVLELARPARSGRPIYCHVSPRGDVFASTHVWMLAQAGIALAENTRVLPEFFVYRFVMAPNTLYHDVTQVAAGGVARIAPIHGRSRITHDARRAPATPRPRGRRRGGEPATEETVGRLERALAPLASAGERIVVLLSGGLDSSVLFKLGQSRYGWETTYSTGFSFEAEGENREKAYAVSAAAALGARHTYYEATTADYLRDVVRAIAAAEAPVHHQQSVLLQALFTRGMEDGRTIVVSGDGADVVFGNDVHGRLHAEDARYWHLRAHPAIHRLLSQPSALALLERTAALTRRGRLFVDYVHPRSAWNRPLADPGHAIWSVLRYGSVAWACRFLGVTERDVIESRRPLVESLGGGSLYDLETRYELLGDSAATQSIWSRLGERCGKLLDFPFCDPALMDHVAGLPWTVKLREPKHVLRRVARALGIPEFIVSRPKSSFGVEPSRWAGAGSVFEPLVPLAARVIDEREIRAVQAVEYSTAMTFWNVLNYAIWKRLWIGGEPLARLLDELEEAMAGLGAGDPAPGEPRR